MPLVVKNYNLRQDKCLQTSSLITFHILLRSGKPQPLRNFVKTQTMAAVSSPELNAIHALPAIDLECLDWGGGKERGVMEQGDGNNKKTYYTYAKSWC